MGVTKPNILFLVIDGMTSKKFFTNQKTYETPTIDSLLNNGTYFNQTVSSASVTIPSMSGIFSALYPFECLQLDDTLIRFNSKLKNFPKYFSEQKYFTIATIPESFSHTGLNEIFEKIHEYNFPSTLFDGLGDEILKNISELSDPWLYYVHLSDFHNEIDFQKIHELKKFDNKKFGDSRIERMIPAFDLWLGKILDKINVKNTLIVITADHGHECLSYNENMMKLEINYENKQFQPGKFFTLGQKIVEKLPEKLNPIRKKLSNTYRDRKKKIEKNSKNPIIEKIGNSQLRSYEKRIMINDIEHISHVYDERFLVPLLFVGLDVPSNKKILQQVRSIDIFPTICDIIDIPITFDSIQGKSLLPLMSDKKIEESPILIDSIVNSTLSQSSNVLGIRTSKFKYFRDRNDPSKNVHLFNLELDPHEEQNIASLHKDIIIEMENIFQKINPSKDFTIKNSNKLSESEINDAKNILKQMGYLNSIF
jgi:arylsulfatase A-like enzyme